MSGLIYLASPWTHANPIIRHQRYVAACKAAGKLMLSGEKVFAPIPHSVAIEEHMGSAPEDPHSWWLSQDFAVLGRCSRLVVLTLDGWEASRGVAAEIEFAQQAGIPISFMEP